MGRNSSRSSRGSAPAGSDGDEPFLDRYTDIDEELSRTNDALETVVKTNRAIAEALQSLSGESFDLPQRNDRPLVADAVVEPQLADAVAEPDDYEGNTREVELQVPRDGSLTRVLLSFPSGANQSLGIGVRGVDGENLVPFGPAGVSYIALNDDNVTFDLEYSVNNDETLTVRFVNTKVATTEDEIDQYTAYLSAILTVTEVI